MTKNDTPAYVVFDPKANQQKEEVKILRQSAKTLTFSLTDSDLEDIKTLEYRFDTEKNMAGLAAVQINIPKKIIIFSCNNLELKKFRPTLTQMMPKTIWINPSYKGIEEAGKDETYEGCFSIKDTVGIVERYSKIRYKAFDMDGKCIEGTAEGFLARIIQHEIDHIHGILCIDRASSSMDQEIYIKMRNEALKR
ncbi:MAG: peptide deformylase [Alphaproteobacteria bacterium]|nr:MAG: peptide deformylase [Alphaproteobacteria bacterium]